MALALLALLIVALIVAAVAFRKERAFEAAATHGEGVITDLRFKRVGPLDDRDVLAYPLVRLTLPDGLTVENWAERPIVHGEVGDEVDVLYLPDDPGRIRINGG